MAKKIGLTVFILVIIIIMGVLIFVPFSKKWPESYTYDSITGRSFNIDVIDDYPGVTYHIVSFYAGALNSTVRKQYAIPFEYSPLELEDIEVPNNLRDRIFMSKGIFITRDPSLTNKTGFLDVVAITTISRVTGSEKENLLPHILGIDTFSAIDRDDGSDRVVLTCENSTKTGRVILMKKGGENNEGKNDDEIADDEDERDTRSGIFSFLGSFY